MEGGPDPHKQIYQLFLNAKGSIGEINKWPPGSNLQPFLLPQQRAWLESASLSEAKAQSDLRTWEADGGDSELSEPDPLSRGQTAG